MPRAGPAGGSSHADRIPRDHVARRLRVPALWRRRAGHSSRAGVLRRGFALNELPFIAAAWLLVSTLLALDQTGLGSPVGVAAVAVANLAMAGLLLVVRLAPLTGPALERALTLGLGAGCRRVPELGPGAGSCPAGSCSPRS